jgi:tRNA 2-thiocytidine biosynthesis protein TtcA
MNLDQKQPGFPDHVLPAYFESIGVEYRIVTENTYKIVKDKIPEGKTTCSLCSRLRRGIIYRTAKELGATKIALGHHRDDMIETLFLNMFFGGKMKSMPPKLVSDDRQNVVIRPLAYCSEKDIERFARGMEYPIIPCNLCGSQENAQRKQIKAMLRDWDARFPGRIVSIATAMKNVVPSHLADNACSISRVCRVRRRLIRAMWSSTIPTCPNPWSTRWQFPSERGEASVNPVPSPVPESSRTRARAGRLVKPRCRSL